MVHKFDKIRRKDKDEGSTFQPDELVYVEEKIDGANFRVWIDEEYRLRFGSRRVEFLPEDDENVGYGAFDSAVNYIKSLNTECLIQGYIYYFEAMIKHTLNYEFHKHPKAILLDIYDIQNDRYCSRNVVEKNANSLNCELPKIIFQGEFKDFVGNVPQSKYGDFQAEGFVIKPIVSSRDSFGNIHRAKVVGEKFKEENREVFGDANDKESSFAMKFTTAGRIDKEIHKLENAKNDKVQPQWIPILTYNITKDICDEEFKKLLKIGTPNLRTIQSEVQRQVKLRLGQLGVL